MIGEYWRRVERQLEDLRSALDSAKDSALEGDDVSACNEIDNAREYADAVYSACESWHSDDNTDELEQRLADWKDLLDMLPDPKSLNAKDMQDLLESTLEWKVSHGFGRNSYDNLHF